MTLLSPDRLFPVEPATRNLARMLYELVHDAPIVSPHGHTDPRWLAENTPFSDPAQLFVTPDHYVFRMFHSQGIPLERLGLPRADGGPVETDNRQIWRLFAENYHLLRGTPSHLWLDHVFQDVFGMTTRLSAATADLYYDDISDSLSRPAFLPRALYEKFGIEVLATTDSPLDDLQWHRALRGSGWSGRVIPTYRPDPVVDPETRDFHANVETFCALGGQPTRRGPVTLPPTACAGHGSRNTAPPRPTTATPPPGPRTSARPMRRRFTTRSWPAPQTRRNATPSGARC